MTGEVHKVVFMGAPGAGKTTCIKALSEIPPLSTDAPCVVTPDYGDMRLHDGRRVLLYALPGRQRFGEAFEAVRADVLGAIVLVDATCPSAIETLSGMLACYRAELRTMPFVVALNKDEVAADAIANACRDAVGGLGLIAPVMAVDARCREDVARLIELLLVIQESGFGFDAQQTEAMA